MTRETLSRIASASLADMARDKIRKAILEGSIRPDDKLTIEQLASELGISRTPVREAIKALEGDGMLRILPNKGIVVQRFTQDELRERYAIRALLEGYAGEIACERQGASLYPVLASNVAEMEETVKGFVPGVDEFQLISHLLELNRQFHRAIVQASGCTTVAKILESLQGPVSYRLYQWRRPERRQAIIDHHRRIALAFRTGDPQQVRAEIKHHLQDINDFLLSAAPQGEGTPSDEAREPVDRKAS